MSFGSILKTSPSTSKGPPHITQNLESSMAHRASLFQSFATFEESRLPMLILRDEIAAGREPAVTAVVDPQDENAPSRPPNLV